MKTGNVFDEDFEAPKKSWLSNFIEGFTNASQQAKMVTRGAKFMNRTDINSVPLGHWVTAKFMASTNISLRDIDQTYQSDWEHRTFHPYKRYNKNSTLPESDVLNSACNKSLSNKLYTTIHETPILINILITIYYIQKNTLQEQLMDTEYFMRILLEHYQEPMEV